METSQDLCSRIVAAKSISMGKTTVMVISSIVFNMTTTEHCGAFFLFLLSFLFVCDLLHTHRFNFNWEIKKTNYNIQEYANQLEEKS